MNHKKAGGGGGNCELEGVMEGEGGGGGGGKKQCRPLHTHNNLFRSNRTMVFDEVLDASIAAYMSEFVNSSMIRYQQHYATRVHRVFSHGDTIAPKEKFSSVDSLTAREVCNF